MSLAKKTVASAAWTTISLVVNQIINLIRLAVLARILSPGDFGVYAMVMIFYMFLTTAGDLGSSSAIVRKENTTHKFLSTMFFTNVGFGCLLTIALLSSAHFIADIYNEPRIVDLLMLVSLTFVVSSLGYVHSALLRRGMRFKELEIANVVANLVSTALCIQFALSGYGYISFGIQVVSHALIFVCILLFAGRWAPSFVFSFSELKPVLKFGANMTAFNFIEYAASNADKFLVGKLLGPAALGSYYFGFRLIVMPFKQITAAVKNVVFSTLSTVQNDNLKFCKIFLTVVRIITFISAPISLIICVLADLIVVVFFGEKWSEAAVVLSALAPSALILTVLSPCGIIYIIKDRTDILVKISLVSILLIPSAVLIGIEFGVSGAALGFTCANFILALPVLYITSRLSGFRLSELMKAINGPIFSSVVLALCVYIFRAVLFEDDYFSDLVQLGASLVVGLVVFLILMGKTMLEEYKNVRLQLV